MSEQNDDDMTYNVRGLEKLAKLLKGEAPVARVGILSSTNPRTATKQGAPTNAEIGALYEFNDGSRPGGSFLRVPIADHLDKRLEQSGAFDADTLKGVVDGGTLVPWLRKVAIVAEGIVLDAFKTSGFGKWRESNMARKKNAQTLVETGQLMDSITWDVKEKG